MQEEYNEAVVKAAEYEHRVKQKQMSIDQLDIEKDDVVQKLNRLKQ